MIIYRSGVGNSAGDISGEGLKIYGGRWNSAGVAALHTSESISLCILEILVKVTKNTAPDNYRLISVFIPGEPIITIEPEKLKKNGNTIPNIRVQQEIIF